METVNIFWDPAGITLDQTYKKAHAGTPADGDTPYVKMSIRMLSIDTPETNYPTIGKPSNTDEELQELAEWLKNGTIKIDSGLAAHLIPKLETGTAGTLQQSHGEKAKIAFNHLLETRLTRPSGRKRQLFIRTADQPFDSYGRLLAYLSPSYSTQELSEISFEDRFTFNLNMVDNGWAATLIIYPSIPKHFDLTLMREKARDAVIGKKGVWADELMLTGYEWRMCVKLHKQAKRLLAGSVKYIKQEDWVARYCLDMTTRKIYYPDRYYQVDPYNRIFAWDYDVRAAVADLNLMSGE